MKSPYYLDQRFHRQVEQEHLLALKKERELWSSRPHEMKWTQVLEKLYELNLPSITQKNYSSSAVEIGKEDDLTTEKKDSVIKLAKELIPWKKGPFKLFGTEIDGEWRSDFKWERLKPDLPKLEGQKILDIGCHNGYFMFRMLEQNPEYVLGIDPVVRTWSQYNFLQHFLQEKKLEYELFGVEHLPYFKQFFDVIFSMGILYHHRNPIQQLIEMRESLRPGGELVLETIAINTEGSYALFPEGRYAQMPNVWFLPTKDCLYNWLKRSRFENIEILHMVPTTPQEQRWTPWCPPGAQSLKDFLDPDDFTLTKEGHPAPYRISLRASKKGKK
jgi:tRNA (mo5U34)-methyltransferase